MVNLVSKVAIVGVVFVAVVYQFVAKTIIFDSLGYGRSLEPLAAFSNVRCEKVDELGLEGCEDMWLHESTGFLYMACSDSQSRTQWLPASVSQAYFHVPLLTLTVLSSSMRLTGVLRIVSPSWIRGDQDILRHVSNGLQPRTSLVSKGMGL